MRSCLLGLLGNTVSVMLKLLVDLGDIGLVRHQGFGGVSRLSNLGGLCSGFRNSLFLDKLLSLVSQVAEDIVKHIVTVRLLSQNKGLNEFARRLRLVGNLADNRDKDVVKRGLGINVQDTDLAVLEVKLLEFFVDSLVTELVTGSFILDPYKVAYLGANSNWNSISLGSKDKLRAARVKERELFRVTAQCGIKLFHEEPSHLVLGDLAFLLLSWGGGGRGGGLGRLEVGSSVQSHMSRVERFRVAMLGGEVAVDRSLHVGHVVGKRFRRWKIRWKVTRTEWRRGKAEKTDDAQKKGKYGRSAMKW